MKVGIMQPYLFPYLGYFQLIAEVDTYVVLDNVNYIKGGFINRNYIRDNKGERIRFSMPISKASSNSHISELMLDPSEIKRFSQKLLKTLSQNYKGSVNYDDGMLLVESCFDTIPESLSEFLTQSIVRISRYMDLRTTILLASKEVHSETNLSGQERVIAICNTLAGKQYVNSIGGQSLYSKEAFANRGLQLSFLKCSDVTYRQKGFGFVPNLSILDVVMNNDKRDLIGLLSCFELS